MPTSKIDYASSGPVATITIMNESKRNAINRAMEGQLRAAFEVADADSEIRCIVITGAGDQAFSSGHDLGEMAGDLRQDARISESGEDDVFTSPSRSHKPVIAAINGAAYAGGLILAIHCDIRVAADHATFAATGSRIGLLPVGGQLSLLPSLMRRGTAAYLLLSGRPLTARDAHHAGLVHEVTRPGEALDLAFNMANEISECSPRVVRSIKRGLELCLNEGFAAGLAFEEKEGLALAKEPDALEGVTAFLEKRQPNFQRV